LIKFPVLAFSGFRLSSDAQSNFPLKAHTFLIIFLLFLPVRSFSRRGLSLYTSPEANLEGQTLAQNGIIKQYRFIVLLLITQIHIYHSGAPEESLSVGVSSPFIFYEIREWNSAFLFCQRTKRKEPTLA
jgi:hypothetical protein